MAVADIEVEEFAGGALDFLFLGFSGVLQEFVAVLQVLVVVLVLMDVFDGQEVVVGETFYERFKFIQ